MDFTSWSYESRPLECQRYEEEARRISSFSFSFFFLSLSFFLFSFHFLSLFSPFLFRISLIRTYLLFILNSHLSPLCMNLTHVLLTWHVLRTMCPTCVTMTQVLKPCVTHGTCTMPCVIMPCVTRHLLP